MKPSVSVFGVGFVGLTTAAFTASRGFKTYGVGRDKEKIRRIAKGSPPFYEPGLESLLKEALSKRMLKATVDAEEAVRGSDITFITVGTPSLQDGGADVASVEEVTKAIGGVLRRKASYHLVVVKSTVPPGTTEGFVKPLLERHSGRRIGRGLGLASNPEFLREGSAIRDMAQPDRVVIGELDVKSGGELERFYRKLYPQDLPQVIRTKASTAEMIKYANNAFLATKISFINTIANICRRTPGADVEAVAKAIGLDPRIGSLFLKAGPGYGGSCLPKDLRALIKTSEALRYRPILLEAVHGSNELQAQEVLALVEDLVGGLSGKTISVLGLAFKKDTDDIREAASIRIIQQLLGSGAKVRVNDPKAMENATRLLGGSVEYFDSPLGCVAKSECCIVLTEWDEYRRLKPEDFIRVMKKPALVDARRIYDPMLFASKLDFAAIGLGLRKRGLTGDASKYVTVEVSWRNPAPAVNAVIGVEGGIVLVKRGREPFKGTWCLPGGFVEYGETVEEAVIREVGEETGLEVSVEELLGVYSNPKRHPYRHVIAVAYLARPISGTLRAGGDVEAVRLFRREKIPRDLAFDHARMLQDYFERASK